MKPLRRIVKTSPEFLDQFEYYFDSSSDSTPFSYEILVREIIPYVIEAFRDDWDDLNWVSPNDGRSRYYEFIGDFVPLILVYGRLESISIDSNETTEEVVLFRIMVDFGEEILEDPEGPTPNR